MIATVPAKFSDEWFLQQYLKYGSVEEAINSSSETLPISNANYHRLVVKNGLVTSAGRHASLPETLHFFRLKAMAPDMPLERLYRNLPPSYKTSLSTLHRLYNHAERGLVNRYAVALVITDDLGQVLIGDETVANSRYGKAAGDASIPMGFAKKDEPRQDSILRVLQQEVFAEAAARGDLGPETALVKKLIPTGIDPIAYFDIVDVRVSVYCIVLPEHTRDFSSYKLTNHRFLGLGECRSVNFRAGVDEIIDIYQTYRDCPYTVTFPECHTASVNICLAQTR